MAAARGSELPEDQEHAGSTPNTESSKPLAVKQTVSPQTKKVGKAHMTNGSKKPSIPIWKVKKRGRPRIKKAAEKLHQETMVFDRNFRSFTEKVNANRHSKVTVIGEKKSVSSRRANNTKRQIPLVPPAQLKSPERIRRLGRSLSNPGSGKHPPKYKLKRVGGNKEHHRSSRRNRSRLSPGAAQRRKQQPNSAKPRKVSKENVEFMANFWTDVEVKLDDLSSLDCGSYNSCVEEEDIVDNADEVRKTTTKRRATFNHKGVDFEGIENFVFNPRAEKFIPRMKSNRKKNNRKINCKSKYHAITMKDLIKSFEGHRLPKMPRS